LFRSSYYRIVAALASSWGGAAPESLVRTLALIRLLGDAAGPSGRRNCYLGHLRRIFPSSTASWRRAVMRQYWITHQRAMIGLYRASTLDRPYLARRVTWTGREVLDEALAASRGVILAAPHFGDERTMHILLAIAGYPMHVISSSYEGAPEIVRKARLEASTRWHHVAFPDDNPRWMYRALESGEVVQIAPTAYGGPRGIWVESFGVPVLASSTAFRLAIATGAALVIALTHALPGLRYLIELRRFDPDPGSPAAPQDMFDAFTGIGREYPMQYNWMNLAIRHRETNTIARLGAIPADEHDLEREAREEDNLPSRIRRVEDLPRGR
jgi:Kdo2-lipid IVA lauroyltransferase/acyltransferase